MKDKYGETIFCSRCRHEIENKKDLFVDNRGMVYCTKCYKIQEFREYSNIEATVLGHRTPFAATTEDE